MKFDKLNVRIMAYGVCLTLHHQDNDLDNPTKETRLKFVGNKTHRQMIREIIYVQLDNSGYKKLTNKKIIINYCILIKSLYFYNLFSLKNS